MKSLSIFSVALVISLMSFGSLKPLMPKAGSRSPAVEKSHVPLKVVVNRYLVAVSK